MKRKPGTRSERITLERVIGNTISSNAALAVNPVNGEVAYPAGTVIVVYSPRKNKQVKFLQGKSNKPITCLSYSQNGKFIAAGESGHQPCVVVWDLTTKQIVAELQGHKFGVSCVHFSLNMKYLVSVGFQHDGFLRIWEWRAGIVSGCARVTSRVLAVDLSDDGSILVTTGARHLKFWNLNGGLGGKGPSVVEGKSAILGAHRDHTFTDVCCGRGAIRNSVFVAASKGILFCFTTTRILEKWVDLRSRVYAMSCNEQFLVCACQDGNIRIFQASSLQYVTTIPKPHPLGRDLLAGIQLTHTPLDQYPDVLAVRILPDGKHVVSSYSDRAVYLWGLEDPTRPCKYRSSTAHSGCLWDIQIFRGNDGPLPADTFVTCSSDSTIRFWNLNCPTRNIYSREMMHLLHTAPAEAIQFMKGREFDGAVPSEGTQVPSFGGVRCLRLRPDGLHLASGDRQGNLRVHDLTTMKCIFFEEAHNGEILTLDFAMSPSGSRGTILLASASRDRLIHVFGAEKNHGYTLLATLFDHSASITAVRFACSGTRLISCAADKSVVFRNVETQPSFAAHRYQHAVVPYGTLYDMDIDPAEKNVITCSGQDRRLSFFSIATGKMVKSYKVESEGDIVKVRMNAQGTYLATSATDKHMRVVDTSNGEVCGRATGHGELVTAVDFSMDGKTLYSVGGDGCIFVWSFGGVSAGAPQGSSSVKSIVGAATDSTPSLPAPESTARVVAEENVEVNLGDDHSEPGPAMPSLPQSQADGEDHRDGETERNKEEREGKEGRLVDEEESVWSDEFALNESILPSWAKADRKERRESGSLEASRPQSKPAVGGAWAQQVEYTLFSEIDSSDLPVRRIGNERGILEDVEASQDVPTSHQAFNAEFRFAPSRDPVAAPTPPSTNTAAHAAVEDSDEVLMEDLPDVPKDNTAESSDEEGECEGAFPSEENVPSQDFKVSPAEVEQPGLTAESGEEETDALETEGGTPVEPEQRTEALPAEGSCFTDGRFLLDSTYDSLHDVSSVRQSISTNFLRSLRDGPESRSGAPGETTTGARGFQDFAAEVERTRQWLASLGISRTRVPPFTPVTAPAAEVHAKEEEKERNDGQDTVCAAADVKSSGKGVVEEGAEVCAAEDSGGGGDGEQVILQVAPESSSPQKVPQDVPQGVASSIETTDVPIESSTSDAVGQESETEPAAAEVEIAVISATEGPQTSSSARSSPVQVHKSNEQLPSFARPNYCSQVVSTLKSAFVEARSLFTASQDFLRSSEAGQLLQNNAGQSQGAQHVYTEIQAAFRSLQGDLDGVLGSRSEKEGEVMHAVLDRYSQLLLERVDSHLRQMSGIYQDGDDEEEVEAEDLDDDEVDGKANVSVEMS